MISQIRYEYTKKTKLFQAKYSNAGAWTSMVSVADGLGMPTISDPIAFTCSKRTGQAQLQEASGF
jgi:hypothetical protein